MVKGYTGMRDAVEYLSRLSRKDIVRATSPLLAGDNEAAAMRERIQQAVDTLSADETIGGLLYNMASPLKLPKAVDSMNHFRERMGQQYDSGFI